MEIARERNGCRAERTAPPSSDRLELIAFWTTPHAAMPLVPASRSRDWMEATEARFANRCLPLLIANQAGWFILSNHELRITWDGTESRDGVRVEVDSGEGQCPALSHFGYGIVTWHIPYLFRTPPGFNLLARGPANWPKDGISPLEGLVETDWSTATFTMNWQMTRAEHPVTFQGGEPVAMIVPQRRAELERFDPTWLQIEDEASVEQEFQAWAASRWEHLRKMKRGEFSIQKEGWQKHYFRGSTVSGRRPESHQTSLKLREFRYREDDGTDETAGVGPKPAKGKRREHESPSAKRRTGDPASGG